MKSRKKQVQEQKEIKPVFADDSVQNRLDELVKKCLGKTRKRPWGTYLNKEEITGILSWIDARR